jgi:hypothetical protein
MALGKPIEVNVVERGHHEVGVGCGQELEVVGSRHAERSHSARPGGLDARDGVLHDEALARGET